MSHESSVALPPVRHSINVPLPLAHAFDLFVRRLPEWWPLATRSVWLNEAASCHVEAHVGGRLYERSKRGEESTWGTFIAFEAPGRVVFTWHPGIAADAATEVEVNFSAAGSSTLVALEHRHWERLGEQASFIRGLFERGWGPVLARLLARASARPLPLVEGPGCVDVMRESTRLPPRRGS
jgi:uncharacterized protein YndB with AHSA1/START domain